MTVTKTASESLLPVDLGVVGQRVRSPFAERFRAVGDKAGTIRLRPLPRTYAWSSERETSKREPSLCRVRRPAETRS